MVSNSQTLLEGAASQQRGTVPGLQAAAPPALPAGLPSPHVPGALAASCLPPHVHSN